MYWPRRGGGVGLEGPQPIVFVVLFLGKCVVDLLDGVLRFV